MNIVVRSGICLESINIVENAIARLTISLSRASAGSNVAGASRCVSMPSKTKKNLRELLPLPCVPRRILSSSTTNCDRLSHRPMFSVHPTAEATAAIVASRR